MEHSFQTTHYTSTIRAAIIATINAADFCSNSSTNHAAIYASKLSTIITAVGSTIDLSF